MIKIALQDVKRTSLLKPINVFWRYRQIRWVRFCTHGYVALLRKSSRWWFQVTSLTILAILLLSITKGFVLAYVNNQHLKAAGTTRLVALEQALERAHHGENIQLVMAQKALYQYLSEAKKYNARHSIVSHFGVDTEKSQVCPYSRALLKSIEAGFIEPTALQLEETLLGFSRNWHHQDKVTHQFLYPLYVTSYQSYRALTELPKPSALDCLTDFWYQSLSQDNALVNKINKQDLKALLVFYAERQRTPTLTLNPTLLQAAEKQLASADMDIPKV